MLNPKWFRKKLVNNEEVMGDWNTFIKICYDHDDLFSFEYRVVKKPINDEEIMSGWNTFIKRRDDHDDLIFIKRCDDHDDLIFIRV